MTPLEPPSEGKLEGRQKCNKVSLRGSVRRFCHKLDTWPCDDTRMRKWIENTPEPWPFWGWFVSAALWGGCAVLAVVLHPEMPALLALAVVCAILVAALGVAQWRLQRHTPSDSMSA